MVTVKDGFRLYEEEHFSVMRYCNVCTVLYMEMWSTNIVLSAQDFDEREQCIYLYGCCGCGTCHSLIHSY